MVDCNVQDFDIDNDNCTASGGLPVGTDSGLALSCNASTIDKVVNAPKGAIITSRTGRVLRPLADIASAPILDSSYVLVDDYIGLYSSVSDAIQCAANKAKADGKTLCAADTSKSYLLDKSIDLTGIRNIHFLSKIDTTQLDQTIASVTIGGLAETNNGGYIRFGEFISDNPPLANDGTDFPQLVISGLKGFIIDLDNIRYLQWYPKSGVEFDSNAYNTINFAGRVCIEEFTGEQGFFWNNENIHYGSRLYKLIIRDNGYPHNHNKWYNPLFEDSQAEIRFENGSNNYLYGVRWEGVSGGNGVYFSEKARMNRIYRTWVSSITPREMVQTPFGGAPYTDLNGTNWFVRDGVEELDSITVFSFNGAIPMVSNGDDQAKPSASTMRSTLNNPIVQFGEQRIQRASVTPAINSSNYIGVSNSFKLLAQSDIIPVYVGAVFALTADLLAGSWRYTVTCFDEYMNRVDNANALSIPSATYNGDGEFHSIDRTDTESDRDNVNIQWPLSFNVASPDVKYIWIGAMTGDSQDNYIKTIECRYFEPPTQNPKTVVAAEEQASELWLTGKPTMGHMPLGASVSTPSGFYVNQFELSTVSVGAASANSIVVLESTNINPAGEIQIGDVVGVSLDSGKVHWSTVSNYSPSTKTVFMFDSIPPGESASAGTVVVFNRWQGPIEGSAEYITDDTQLISGRAYTVGDAAKLTLPTNSVSGDLVRLSIGSNVTTSSGFVSLLHDIPLQYYDDNGITQISPVGGTNIADSGNNQVISYARKKELIIVRIGSRWEIKS